MEITQQFEEFFANFTNEEIYMLIDALKETISEEPFDSPLTRAYFKLYGLIDRLKPR